ncbi:hypothetical protein C7H19_24555, partial [Aphanothece hegewaldii CCALA 016]
WFKPILGYTGLASFELMASDGFSASNSALIMVNVSSAPLLSLDFVERHPKLQVGEQIGLKVIGDFADQQDVVLPNDYLTWYSENATVASVTGMGLVTGLSNGTTVLGAERNGIQAVTASRIGKIPAPTNQTEFHIALAEEQGLEIYPDAVTLTAGVNRQILVTINREVTFAPDFLSGDETGTRYLVSNPHILSVSPDGLITPLNEGIAQVTVIYGATEAVLPVRVETPHLGATTLSTGGGVVQGSDGSLVMVPEGALTTETMVNITPLALNDLALPIPEKLAFQGAFKLEIGDEELALPVQLAIPAPQGLALGTQVFFMLEGKIPDETGALNPIWLLEESGIVGSDGMIRTASPPWKGATIGGNYSIVVPTFNFNEAQFLTGLAIGVVGIYVVAAGGFLAYRGISAKGGSPGLGVGLIGAGLGLYTIGGILIDTSVTEEITVIQVPKIGLPYKTSTNVELNLAELVPGTTPVIKIDVPPPPNTSDITPIVKNVALDFDEEGVLVRVIGSHFGEQLSDLKINFEYGSQSYQQAPFNLQTIGNSQEEIVVRVPNYFPISKDLNFTVARKITFNDGTIETEKSETIYVPIPLEIERAVTVNRLSDEVSFINTLNPKEVVNQSNSANLLLARLPIGNPSQSDLPRHLAATNDASRVYIPLENSQSVAVVDAIGLRNLDTDPTTSEIDDIKLDPGSRPSSIVISPDDQFAYIGDLAQGVIYFLNIDPQLERKPKPQEKLDPYQFYHEYGTINFSGLLSEVGGIRQLAINNNGTLLFATTGKQIVVIDIDKNSPKRHKPIQIIDPKQAQSENSKDLQNILIEIEGIAATPDANKMIFTNRGEDGYGFGYIEIENNDTNNFKATIKKYAQIGLGSTADYFDVNEAVAVTMIRDPITNEEYAFVAGRNSRNLGQGLADVDADSRAGSSIGIIKDPLKNPQLIAATRPIPNGYLSALSISSDNNYLTASYPFVGTFIYDVKEIIKTIKEHQNSLNPFKNLTNTPLEEFNSQISVAANPNINGNPTKDNPVEARYSLGLVQQSIFPVIDKIEVAVETKPTQTIKINWKIKDGVLLVTQPELEPEKEKGKIGIDSSVELYISTFPQNQGLFPKDWAPEGYTKGDKDYNPNRIWAASFFNNAWYVVKNALTSEEQKEEFIELSDGRNLVKTKQTNPFEFILPDDRQLTAGQTYYVGIRAIGSKSAQLLTNQLPGQFLNNQTKTDIQWIKYEVPLSSLADLTNNSPFNSVTILTRGVEPEAYDHSLLIDYQFNELAYQMEKFGSLVMKYNRTTSDWQSVTFNESSFSWIPNNQEVVSYSDKPLVLLVDWIPIWEEGVNSTSSLHNAGFAEAAADTLFASLVQLDLNYWGSVGRYKNGQFLFYESNGSLIRNQGEIFNSPLHFIGFGQGAVVNSEIIQRLGTFYPEAGGTNPLNRDLQMTTIDPYQYTETAEGTFANILDPSIKIWKNVTYADNYFQTNGTGLIPINGRKLDSADWNVNLNHRAGFDEELNTNLPHRVALDWYLGTANLSYDGQQQDDTKIYRRLGDLYTKENEQPDPTTTWYTPDHTKADFISSETDTPGAQDAPWEGIGTGWFHSVVGGGYSTRPYNLLNGKVSNEEIQQAPLWKYARDLRLTSVTEDNTYKTKLRGDFAVPTLFNGNFDAIAFQEPDQSIPGWSFYNGANAENVLQKYLESGVAGNQSYALKLGDGLNSITHNLFVVPDWGVLRFDVYVPKLNGGTVKATLESNGQSKTETIYLTKANGSYDLGYNNDDTYKIEYGNEGFETFHIEVPSHLRGKVATLKFEVNGGTVYLDDVFFKSEHLLLGSPILTGQPARVDTQNFGNNYLVERPQYTLSYNDALKGPNWVAYKLDQSSLGSLSRPPAPWSTTPDSNLFIDTLDYPWKRDDLLPFTTLTDAPDYRFTDGYQRGHMVTDSHRNATTKDQFATYYTSSMLPQHENNNSFEEDEYGNIKYKPAWLNFENYLRNVVNKDANRELYVFSGGLGFNSEITNKGIVNPKHIKIPDYTWKISVLTFRGEDLTKIFPYRVQAIITPNTSKPSVFPYTQTMPDGNQKIIYSLTDWQNWQTWQVSYKDIEAWTGIKFFETSSLSSSLSTDSEGYRIFINSLSVEGPSVTQSDSLNLIHGNTIPLINVPTVEFSHNRFFVQQFNELPASTDTITEAQSSFVNETSFSSLKIGIFKNDPNPLTIGQSDFSHIGSSKIRTTESTVAQVSSSESSVPKIAVHNTSPREINIAEVSSSKDATIQGVILSQEGIVVFGSPDFIFNVTQVQPTQIQTTKITFSSSVSSQQRFSSHLSHNQTSQLVTNIKSSTTNIWESSLKSENYLDISQSLQAPLTTAPLVAILNSDFDITSPNDPNFGWNQRGAAIILNSKAILTENSPFLSNFTQTFIIPESAKTLQFTLTATELGHSHLAPPDAFEVALLDANTLTPLVGTSIGLSQTDSFFNLQANGT